MTVLVGYRAVNSTEPRRHGSVAWRRLIICGADVGIICPTLRRNLSGLDDGLLVETAEEKEIPLEAEEVRSLPEALEEEEMEEETLGSSPS